MAAELKQRRLLRRLISILAALILALYIVLVDAQAPNARSTSGGSKAPNSRPDTSWYLKSKPRGSFEVCQTPSSCQSIAKYPVDVYASWECGLYHSGRCWFKAVPNVGPAYRQAAMPQVDHQQVVRYPKIIGSQNMMPVYQHTDDHFVLEAAKQLLVAGATCFKFDLKNLARTGKVLGYIEGKGPLAILTNLELPYLQLLDLPFRCFMIWAGRLGPPGRKGDIDGWDVYKEMYSLTAYLLKRHQGSGKTFYIGHWEGDWTIRDVMDKDANANPSKVRQMVKLLTDKQRGIDDAKRDNSGIKNVFVWHYAEANLVENSMRKGPKWESMINTIIPQVRPVIDYVSVSVGGDSFREWNPTNGLWSTLDYAKSKLPHKSGVPEPRIFVGEFYFSTKAADGRVSAISPDADMQKQRALWAAAAGIAWGVDHMMWWQFQENELTTSGQYRGFWLVDNGRQPTPLWRSLQQYYKDANDFVRSVYAATGQWPSNYAFRRWAVPRLIELSGRVDDKLWKPSVRG